LETAIGDGHEWGCHIRSSPQQDPELLQKLDQFVPPWDAFSKASVCLKPVEFYDVIQWLKVSFCALEANSHSFVDIPQPSTQLD
jgi:hypothetical protein